MNLPRTVVPETLDGLVEAADGDVGPVVHVLLLGEKSQLVAVHRTLNGERAEDVETHGRHANYSRMSSRVTQGEGYVVCPASLPGDRLLHRLSANGRPRGQAHLDEEGLP